MTSFRRLGHPSVPSVPRALGWKRERLRVSFQLGWNVFGEENSSFQLSGKQQKGGEASVDGGTAVCPDGSDGAPAPAAHLHATEKKENFQTFFFKDLETLYPERCLCGR